MPDTGIVLVATDGEDQSRGALAAAKAVATQLGLPVQVLAVNWPKPMIAPDAPLVFDPYLESARRAELLERARSQTEPYATSELFAGPEVHDGDPPRVIARLALERHARVVITGLGRHQIIDRLFGDETALQLIRESRVPVLAVPENFSADFGRGARRAIVAMDFSEGSTRAAQAVADLLPPRSTVELVHVMPRDQDLGYALIPIDEYMLSVERNLSILRSRLTIPPYISVQERILSGNPAAALLAHAAEHHADIIAAGSHGYGLLARIVIGSVTTKLLRAATCAVLVVPPDTVPNTLGSEVREADASSLGQPTPA